MREGRQGEAASGEASTRSCSSAPGRAADGAAWAWVTRAWPASPVTASQRPGAPSPAEGQALPSSRPPPPLQLSRVCKPGLCHPACHLLGAGTDSVVRQVPRRQPGTQTCCQDRLAQPRWCPACLNRAGWTSQDKSRAANSSNEAAVVLGPGTRWLLVTVGWPGGSFPPGWDGASKPSRSEAHSSSFGKGRMLRFWGGGRECHTLRLRRVPQATPLEAGGRLGPGAFRGPHILTLVPALPTTWPHAALWFQHGLILRELKAQGTPLRYQALEATSLWPICRDRGPFHAATMSLQPPRG